MTEEKLKAPFPYFGGKSTVSDIVWDALGSPVHYIEPFFGSGAVLLNRPNYSPRMTETVNDKDGFVANAWRALKADPDAVAEWADWPVNHADLNARRRRLIANEDRLLESLVADDEWFDAKLAGYWIWAASCWIGSGLTSPNAILHISHSGKGVHAVGKRHHVSNTGMGVHAVGQIPHVSNTGMGVHAVGQIPHVSDTGMGVHAVGKSDHIYEWFRALSNRLRRVRVVCGDWNQVCGGDWQSKMGVCGMFFDPPYGIQDRDVDIYRHDSTSVAQDVEAWCLARGQRTDYRIVVAGYEGEYKTLEADGWRVREWKAQGGYGNTASGESQGKANRHRERLWFSPHCLNGAQSELEMEF